MPAIIGVSEGRHAVAIGSIFRIRINERGQSAREPGELQMKWHVVALAALLIVGCGKPQETPYQPAFSERGADAPREYIVGILPLHNPKHLVEVYGPLIDYLNAGIPQGQFRLEASRNYEEFEKKLYEGHFDFAMPNPYQTVRSLKCGYRVFAKMGDDALFRGIILVRKDSGIRRVTDLRGKKVSYPAQTALAATLMPQYYLQTHGIDVNRDIENLYVGSQESSIMNVLRGHVAAGTTWLVSWKAFQQDHPEMAAQLVVKWQTGTLPNNGWVVRDDVSRTLTAKFGRMLEELGRTPNGRDILRKIGVSRFEQSDDETYRPVQQYLKVFSETVRHIEY
jgi:phosphate/phosphite/phosphonate ABC transporter binding protein